MSCLRTIQLWNIFPILRNVIHSQRSAWKTAPASHYLRVILVLVILLSLPQKTDTFDVAALLLHVPVHQTCFSTTSHVLICLVHVTLSWNYNKGVYQDALQFPQPFPSVRQTQGDSNLFAFSYNFVFVAFNKVTKITFIAFILNVIDIYINLYITHLYIMHICYGTYVCMIYTLYICMPAKWFQLFLTLCDSVVNQAPLSMRA